MDSVDMAFLSRIIRLPSMKVIEVYPGDGSVLVSQGPSAQFFQHIIPQDGKVSHPLQ